MLKLRQNFILITLFVISLQGCQTPNHMAFEWKYRKDYKISENIAKERALITPSTDSNTLAYVNHINVPSIADKHISSITAIETHSKQIQAQQQSGKTYKRAIYKRPELQPTVIENPPPSKNGYYNSYEYNGEHYRKVPRSARLGFIFSLIGLIPIYGFFLAVAGVILGAVGLSKIVKNKERYRGIGFAVTAVVLGLAIVIFYGLINYLFVSNGRRLFIKFINLQFYQITFFSKYA